MRRALVAVALALAACAHKPPPPPAPPPPPEPKGDLLRLEFAPGTAREAHVKMAIEQEVAGAQGGKSASRKLSLGFEFVEEAKVESVGSDGVAQLSARYVDAVGTAGAGADQKMVDDFALVLDELKIKFKVTPRGEIQALAISGVRPPVEEQTARAMLNAVYSAQRGPLFPEEKVDVGGTWKVDTALPPSSGFNGLVSYSYVYARKGGGVAVVTAVGEIDGKSGAKRMKGQSVSEYRLELESGRLIGTSVDADVTIEQTIPGQQTIQTGVRQKVHAEWRLKVE